METPILKETSLTIIVEKHCLAWLQQIDKI